MWAKRSEGVDEVAVARADGVAVDAARLDLRTPAALDGLVDPDHDWPLGHEGLDQLVQELPRKPPA
jgi:hypothetical protein